MKEKTNKIYQKYEEFIKNFENFAILSYRTGIFFLVFLYVENENITKIIKNKFYGFISIIFVYSLNDILKYLSQKLNFNNPLDNPLLENIFNIEIPKITFEQSPEDKYQDGCFELAETFDINLIKNKFLLCLGQEIDFLSATADAIASGSTPICLAITILLYDFIFSYISLYIYIIQSIL